MVSKKTSNLIYNINEKDLYSSEIMSIPDGWDTKTSTTISDDTNDINKIKEEYQKAFLIKDDIFAFTDFKSFPDDYLIINDVYLTGIPTTGINISYKSDILVAETLRTSAPIVSSKGRRDIQLNLVLVFKQGIDQSEKLRRIIATISKNPYIFIHNNYIKKSLSVSEDQTTIFALEHASLRSSSDSTGIVILEMSMHLFNYKPFSNHFYYNGKLGGITTEIKDPNNINTPIDISELDGYEASNFTISKYTEKTRRTIKKNLELFASIKKQNVPVSFPSESDAWMYYADNLSSTKYIPELSGEQSDYVGISVNEYRYMSPPAEARIGGDFKNFYLEEDFKPTVYPYKVNETKSTFTHQSVELLTKPTNKKQLTKFKNTKTGSVIDVKLLTDFGEANADAAFEISKIWRVGKYKDTTVMQLGLVKKLAILSSKFPNKTIEIISLTRNSKPGKKPSKHATGHAMDLRIRGVNNETIVKYMRTIDGTGVGYYPNSVFVHIDSRDKSAFWVDVSGPGEKSSYIPKKDWKNWTNRIDSLSEAQTDREERDSEKNYNIPLDSQKDIQNKINKKKQDKEIVVQTREKSEEARQLWIDSLSEQGWNLYEDKTIKNVFYKRFGANISGNINSQTNNLVLKNIVLSAVSISFGHRLAPLKLLGQDVYTYQFLGAGNKSGQLVFTFSGKEGRNSANYIKELISKANISSRQLGSVIKEAGSIELSSLFLQTGEQNTILSLLNINNVIVTNIEESSDPNGVEKHQLLIEFIAQDFQEEELQKRFLQPLSSKKKTIKRILSYLTKSGTKNDFSDTVSIFPKRTIAKVNQGSGRAYSVVGDTPSWFANIIVKAAQLCQEINNEIPPVKWKTNKATSKTWLENYTEWGANHIFTGRVKNISIFEKNGTTDVSKFKFGDQSYLSHSSIVPNKLDTENTNKRTFTEEDMYRDVFEYDGGQRTNTIHEQKFQKWLDKMNSIVNEVDKYISDEENFKKYFGDIGEEKISSIAEELGICYKDLNLPNVPDTDIPLPPEYYIYDDSSEDPLFSSLTDKTNLEKLLKKQAELEFSSVKHFMRDSLLGGSYLSKNLPRILENRALAQETYLKGEFGFIDSFSALFNEGTYAWEPIYYREDTSGVSKSLINTWQQSIASFLGGGTDLQQRFSFMNDIVNLSPYLKKGRRWNTPYNEQDNQTLIESLYGDAWNKITFGPNPEYTTVDSILDGKSVSKDTVAFREKVTEAGLSKYADIMDTQIELQDKTITADGAVTVGSINEEKEEESWFSKALHSFLHIEENIEAKKREIEKGSSLSTTLFLRWANSPLFYGIYSSYKNFENNLTNQLDNARQIATIRKEQLKHPIGDKVTEENNAEVLAQLSSGIALGNKKNDLSFRRALPTFKIYLIEDDSNLAFDDFYSYSAIQEIRITRSRKIAADLAIIRMTNVGGKLFRKRYKDKDTDYRNAERQGIFADTELENPFEKLVLQDGVKIQIRIGYSGNPDLLESAFLGQIVEVSLAEEGKIVEIMCQGYGAELESTELGPLEDGPVFYSSQQVLSGSIIQDSIVNFGRKNKHNVFNPAEVRHAWTGGNGESVFGSINPFNLIEEWSNNKLDKLFSQYNYLNYPQDDNIFAPPPSVYATFWEKFWNNAWIYRPIKQTPWQIFKEHELRHPGYISLAVPYGHSTRMTMFFGPKSQHYWCKPPSALELELCKNASNSILNIRNLKQDPNFAATLSQRLQKVASSSPLIANAIVNDIIRTDLPTSTSTYIGEQFGRYRPFRNYHYFDSQHHILKNEIRTSVDGVFNEVELLFFEDEDVLQDTDTEDLNESLAKLHREEAGFLSVKLDENIPDSALRSYRDEYPSCVTEIMAKRYAQGLFARHLRDAYKGELVVTGKETLKPFDIAFIFDSVSQMYGPIEVEAVTHIFNRDNGFVSVITPDLCVEINELYSASAVDVVGSALGIAWGGLMTGGTSAGILTSSIVGGAMGLASATGLGLLAVYGGMKFVSWTQDGDPVIVTPLTLAGKPFISNSLGTKKTSLFLNLLGKWNQYWDDLDKTWDEFDLSEAFLDTKIDLTTKIYSLLGSGPQGGVR